MNQLLRQGGLRDLMFQYHTEFDPQIRGDDGCESRNKSLRNCMRVNVEKGRVKVILYIAQRL